MKKIFLLTTITLFFLSCSRDENSSSSSSSTTNTQTTTTSIKMNIVNAQNVPQSNVIVMMFKSKVTSSANLPAIEKQVTSDSNGLANFDLSTYITSDIPTTYYFEAFRQQGNNLVWVSTIHPEISIKKNTQVTTSIIVN